MDICVITFRSITPAQRGEGVLRRAGFICTLQRTPRWLATQGCGYSIRIRCDEIGECARVLQENGVRFQKIYQRRADGKLEEVAL